MTTPASIEIVVPQVGEAVSEVVLIEWFKKEGEAVKKGEPLFEVDTDKAVVEVEAFTDGTLLRILVPDNSPVMPQQVVGLMAAADEVGVSGPDTAHQTEKPVDDNYKISPVAEQVAAELGVDVGAIPNEAGQRIKADDVRHFAAQQLQPDPGHDDRKAGWILASPKARRLAKELGLSLAGLVGTGLDGLITAKDVQASAASGVDIESGQEHPQIQPFSKLRQTIAARMQASKQTVPHFYLMADVDMSQAQQIRHYCRETLGWQRSPTYTDLIVRACALTLKALPKFNLFYTDEGVVQRRSVDIGVAVSLDDGLIVPVLPQADRLNLQQTSSQIRGLAKRTRQGRLRDGDLSSKSMVISNLGMYGVDAFVAIIDMPDPMILAVGQVADQPAVVDGQLAIRPKCTLTLSADHRVLDGAQGAEFLGRVKAILEQPYQILGAD